MLKPEHITAMGWILLVIVVVAVMAATVALIYFTSQWDDNTPSASSPGDREIFRLRPVGFRFNNREKWMGGNASWPLASLRLYREHLELSGPFMKLRIPYDYITLMRPYFGGIQIIHHAPKTPEFAQVDGFNLLPRLRKAAKELRLNIPSLE